MMDSRIYNSINNYNKNLWKQVENLEVLKKEEELTLAKLMSIYVSDSKNINKVDEETFRRSYRAYEKLYKHNIKLVFKIASNYEGRGLKYDDLVQEGLLGLQTGLRKFDYTLGNRVSTYVSSWIAQNIGRAIETHRTLIRIPAHVQQKYRDILKSEEKLSVKLNRKPTVEEIALDTGIELLDVTSYMSIYSNTYTLDSSINEEGDSYLGLTCDSNTLDNYQMAKKYYRKYYIEKFIDTLDPKSKDIMNEYYQFDETKAKVTLKDIGNRYDCTKENIRQCKMKTIDKFKHYIIENNLMDLYSDYL